MRADPATLDCRIGPNALLGFGGKSARFKPAHNLIRRQSNLFPILEPARPFLPSIKSRRTFDRLLSPFRGSRSFPSLPCENINYLRHSFLLSSSVVADRKMTRGTLNGTQKVIE